jgi:hypothetical protein
VVKLFRLYCSLASYCVQTFIYSGFSRHNLCINRRYLYSFYITTWVLYTVYIFYIYKVFINFYLYVLSL